MKLAATYSDSTLISRWAPLDLPLVFLPSAAPKDRLYLRGGPSQGTPLISLWPLFGLSRVEIQVFFDGWCPHSDTCRRGSPPFPKSNWMFSPQYCHYKHMSTMRQELLLVLGSTKSFSCTSTTHQFAASQAWSARSKSLTSHLLVVTTSSRCHAQTL